MVDSMLCVDTNGEFHAIVLALFIKRAFALKREGLVDAGISTAREQCLTITAAHTALRIPDDRPVDTHVVDCARRYGLDLRGCDSRPLKVIDLAKFDIIVCMNDAVSKEILALHPRGAVLIPNLAATTMPNNEEEYIRLMEAFEVTARKYINTFF